MQIHYSEKLHFMYYRILYNHIVLATLVYIILVIYTVSTLLFIIVFGFYAALATT